MHKVIKLNCLHCGAPFTRQWPNAKQVYCSSSCLHGAWRSRNKEKAKARTLKWNKQFEREHGKTYDRAWRERNRQLIRAREKERLRTDDEFRKAKNSRSAARRKLKLSKRPRVCADCGGRKMVGCHHVNFNVFDNDLGNLVWLCHWCHMKRHWEFNYG